MIYKTINNEIMIGKKMFYGIELVEVCSIVVRGMVNVKYINPTDNEKITPVYVYNLTEY